MTALHALGILSAGFMRRSPGMVFQRSWMSSCLCWALIVCFSFTLRSNSSQTISTGLGRVIVEARASDTTLLHARSWLKSPHITWRSVSPNLVMFNSHPSDSSPLLSSIFLWCTCTLPTASFWTAANATLGGDVIHSVDSTICPFGTHELTDSH